MFIRFFKSNNASSFVFLPAVVLVLWVFGFISPSVLPVKHTMPLYELVAGMFVNIPWLSTLIAFLLITGEAFLLNYIVTRNEIIIKQSYLPALLYIVLMSSNNELLMLHPVLLSNLFLLFAVNKLLSSYRKDLAFSQAFDAGFLVSVATLFYFPSIAFLPLLGAGLLLIRPFIWREWVISFIGVIVPYLFVSAYYFVNDTSDYFWYDKVFFPMLTEKPGVSIPHYFYFMLGLSSFILLLSFSKVFSGLSTGAQKTKKGMVLMIWFFIFSAISLFIAPEISSKFVALMLIPVSVFSAHLFVNMKKEWLGELLFLLLLASVFVNLIAYYF